MSEVKELLARGKKPKNEVNQDKSALFVRPDLHQEFKEYCITEGFTMREMAEALISDFLDEQNYKRSAK